MKRCLALGTMAGVCALGTAFGDVTFRSVVEMKFNMPMPMTALPPGFSGPTEVTARVKGTRSYSSFGKIASIMDFRSGEMILLDTQAKKYASTTVQDYMAQVAQAAAPNQQIPEEARKVLEGMQFNVQAHDTGRSERIQGIDASETEILFTLTVPVPIPGGNGQGLEVDGKFQMWKPKPGEMERVPALREMTAYYDQAKNLGKDTASMLTRIFAALPGMGDKIGGLVNELQRGGSVNLRLHGEVSIPGMAAMMAQAKTSGANVPDIPNGPLFSFDSSLKEINTDAVPDSAFKLPEGYQEAPVADLVKAFTPGTPGAK